MLSSIIGGNAETAGRFRRGQLILSAFRPCVRSAGVSKLRAKSWANGSGFRRGGQGFTSLRCPFYWAEYLHDTEMMV